MTVKVLVIDDDPALLRLMENAFARCGFQTFAAKDGVQGVRLCDSQRPDLVVTDILMPEKEGIATIIDVKQGVDPPKVIAISGGGLTAGQDFLCWAKELGADRVMLKPFRMSALVVVARELLGLTGPPGLKTFASAAADQPSVR
jgi:DNA-binding response OmpR family regulator